MVGYKNRSSENRQYDLQQHTQPPRRTPSCLPSWASRQRVGCGEKAGVTKSSQPGSFKDPLPKTQSQAAGFSFSVGRALLGVEIEGGRDVIKTEIFHMSFVISHLPSPAFITLGEAMTG